LRFEEKDLLKMLSGFALDVLRLALGLGVSGGDAAGLAEWTDEAIGTKDLHHLSPTLHHAQP
jgi:hypothetical protein